MKLFSVLLLSGLEAMEAALELEKKVNKSLLDLHKVADSHGDFQVRINQFTFFTKKMVWVKD